jgi:FkbM family methyltransferase
MSTTKQTYPYKSSHIDYFQIGAHIGNSHNDPIYNEPMTGKNIILVEPVPFLYDILKHNYQSRIRNNEIEFLNIAVSDYDGTIQMTAPSKDNDFDAHPFFLNQMASTTDKYIKQFNFQERFPTFQFETITVPCRTLTTIVKERGITSIDHLIVDTEGHDETILRAFDFQQVKPKRITFENAYMDDILPAGQVQDTPHSGEEGHRPKYRAFLQFLASHDYRVVSENTEDTVVEWTPASGDTRRDVQ